MSHWQFLSPTPDAPSASKIQQRKGQPPWYEEVRQKSFQFDATAHHGPSEVAAHWKWRNEARRHVAESRRKMASALLASPVDPRLVALDYDYRTWLLNTSSPLIMEFHCEIDAEHTRLCSIANPGGSRESHFELCGRVAACRYGMGAALLLREQHCPDIGAAFEQIKSEMAECAVRKANELASQAAVDAKYGKLLMSTHLRQEEARVNRIERVTQRRALEAKHIEAKQVAAKKAKTKAAVDQTFVSVSSPSPSYKR
jgi:hypothetical protein